ncbi:hypothetical protein Ancab_020587 [Ancistrocladus abbreviatus]
MRNPREREREKQTSAPKPPDYVNPSRHALASSGLPSCFQIANSLTHFSSAELSSAPIYYLYSQFTDFVFDHGSSFGNLGVHWLLGPPSFALSWASPAMLLEKKNYVPATTTANRS